MSLSIRLHSAASPEQVLEAIRRDAREWRESVVPEELQRDGMRRMAAEFSGSRFTLSMPTLVEGASEVVLRAQVLPDDSGGSSVVGECGLPSSAGARAEWLALPGAVLLLAGYHAFGALLLGCAAVGMLGDNVAERRIKRGEDEVARYLVLRLESVLASLDQAGAKP